MTQDRWLRWTALVAFLMTVALNASLDFFLPGLPAVEEVAGRYENLFTPADWAFSLGGLVYLTLLAYAAYSLSASQARVAAHDRLAHPFTAFSLLAMGWLVLFRSGYVGAALVLTVLMLATGISMFRHALRLYPRVAAFPFSLLLGCLSLATVSGVFTWVVSLGWRGSAPGEPFYGVASLALVGALAVWINYRFASLVFPLVLALGSFALAFEHRNDCLPVHLAALAVGVSLVAWSAVAAATSRRRVLLRRAAYLR